MLGTNDFQSAHQNNAWLSAQGLASVIRAMRRAPIEPGMPVPPILVVAPPPIRTPPGGQPIWEKFDGAPARAQGAADAYKAVAAELECAFFDAGKVVSTSEIDGVHLDAEQHATLGSELARVVADVLAGVEAAT